MSEDERGGADLEGVGDIAGGTVDGLGTGVRDGGGDNEIRAGVEFAERWEHIGATEGGLNSVRGVNCWTEARN